MTATTRRSVIMKQPADESTKTKVARSAWQSR